MVRIQAALVGMALAAWRIYDMVRTTTIAPKTGRKYSRTSSSQIEGRSFVISVYTDEQAVDDGLLVDISSYKLHLSGRSVNLITRHLYDELMKYADHDSVKLKGILRDKLCHARMPGDGPQDGYFYVLPLDLWAIQNNSGGYTLMLPQDY